MKKITTRLLFLLAIYLFGCSTKERDVEVSFKEVKLQNDSNRVIRIQIKNNSQKNVFILTPIILEKVGKEHPCLEKMIYNYTKLSSHKIGDCVVNRGEKLFNYLGTVPFNKNFHKKLRDMAVERSGEGLSSMFDYLNPKSSAFGTQAGVTYLKSNSSTFIYYKLTKSLSLLDHGEYILNWIPKKELDPKISIKKNKMSVKDALNINIEGYKYYGGEVLAHPYVIKL